MDRMKQTLGRVARALALLGLMNLWLGTDCWVSQPCWPQDRLDAHLVEVYDEGAQSVYDWYVVPSDLPVASCEAFDNLIIGSHVPLTIIERVPGTYSQFCIPIQASAEVPGALAPRDVGRSGDGRYSLYAQGDLTMFDGCRGEWALVFVSGGQYAGVTNTPWAAGAVPPAIWVRYFRTTTAENCPTLPAGSTGTFECADVWAGEILTP